MPHFKIALSAGLFFAMDLAVSGLAIAATSQTETPVFRFDIPTEPASLDPARMVLSETGYFYSTVMRGLFTYSNEKGLQGEGAEKCFFKTQLKVVCQLRNVKWNNGDLVEAQDYVRSFRHLVSVNSRSTAVELLRKIKNAVAVHSGKAPAEALGVKAETKDRLLFELEAADPELFYKLSSSVLVPLRRETFPPMGELSDVLFNGPYQVVSWQKGRRLRLEKNPHYRGGNPDRPPVEVLFIDDEQTALNLYEQKQLSFLRRLPTANIAKFQARDDFKQIPMARFDYLGFGDLLRDHPDLRAALSYSADFSEMKKLLGALGMPGCPGLGEEYFDRPRCVTFDLPRAKKHLAKFASSPGGAEILKKRFKLMFTRLGGDDARRSMEWFQAQWKKNLGIQVDIEGLELQTFLETLRKSPPAVFRKGVSLERPTCLAALENFLSQGAENFLKVASPALDRSIERLLAERKSSSGGFGQKPSAQERQICGEGLQVLLDENWLVPLGRMHFTVLADPNFQDWSLSEMNHLDLASLRYVAKSKAAH